MSFLLPSVECCLGKTESSLHAPPDLRTHGLTGVGGSGSSVLVLGGAAEEVVEALGHAAPGDALDDLLLDLGHVAAVLPGGGEERAGDFVGHALELGVDEGSELLAAGKLLLAQTLGEADGVGVVGGDDDAAVGPCGGGEFRRGGLDDGVVLAVDEGGHHAVVACVGVFNGVVNQAALLGEEVGATDEFCAEGEALLAGDVDVLGELVGCRLEVALVGVVENGLAITVEDTLKVEGPGVVAGQVPGLLGGRQEADVLLGGSLADQLHGLVHGLGRLLLGGAEAERGGTHSAPLETDEVTLLGDRHRGQHALLPSGDVLDFVGLSILEDLAGVLEDNTTVALLTKLLRGRADLLGSGAGAELLVEGVVQQSSGERVLLQAEEEALALQHTTEDGGGSIQHARRGGHGGDQVRAQDLSEREESEGRGLGLGRSLCGDGIGSRRVEVGVCGRVVVVWRGMDVSAVGSVGGVRASGCDVAGG
jgi:hypothetical protein